MLFLHARLIDDGMERVDLTRQGVAFVLVDLVLVLVILMLLVFDELCLHWLKLTCRRKEVLKLVYSSGLGVVVVDCGCTGFHWLGLTQAEYENALLW